MDTTIDPKAALEAIRNYTPIDRDTALKSVNRELLGRFRQKNECDQRARSKPLPGSAGKAFTSGPINAGGKVVNRVVPAHFALLQALESPILKMIESAAADKEKKSEVDFKPREEWELCYVFTEDVEASYELLESKGVAELRKAIKKAAMSWEGVATNLIMMAVVEQIKRHVETTVRFAAEMEKDGQVTFFREQPETN